MAGSGLFEPIMDMVSGFGTDIQTGVISLVGVLVPTGLTLWGIGFGLKKGLGFLQKKASKAL